MLVTSWQTGLSQILSNAVAAKRQGQAGLLVPPDAEVQHEMQTEILICQLALVNDQPGVGFAVFDELGDLVEMDGDRLEGLRRLCRGTAGGRGMRS